MANSAFTPAVLTVSSGTGSGSGEKNYITNPSMASATTGWNVVGDFTLTRTTAASELPREYTTGTGIKLVATSGTQSTADYMYFDFNLDDVDLNRKLKIQWSQKDVGTYAAGQLAVIITSQADRTTALHTPVTTAIPAVDGDFVTSFDSGSTAALSLVIRATTDMTTGDGIVISDVIVGPGEIVQGAVVSEWQSYSSGSTVLPAGLSTQYRRVGDVGEFRVVGATTGTSSSVFVVGLPTGLTFSSSFGVNQPLPGNAEVEDSVSAGAVFHGIPVYASSTSFKIKVSDKTTNAYWGNTTPVAFATNSGYRVMITTTISIAEFSGSGTINLGPGAQVEYAATSGTWDADSSTTVYGPSGVALGGSLTADRTKTVTFQYPIQQDDQIILEFSTDGTRWLPQSSATLNSNSIPSKASLTGAGPAAIGARVDVTGSTTAQVVFGRYQIARLDDGTNAANWPSSSAYWRVRKAKASSPVGFGLVTGTDSGLMKATSSLGLMRYNTSNGYGSTNTAIRRFSTLVSNTSSVTYADTAANGTSFTITESGIYAITYADSFSAAALFGLSRNSTQLNVNVANITASDRLVVAHTSAANLISSVSWSGYLSSGDVIRPHADATTSGTTTIQCTFTIQRIA